MLIKNRRIIRLLSLIILGLIATFTVACIRDHPQSTFDAQGPVAQTQLNVFWLIFWLGLIVYLFVQALIIFIIIKYRRRSTDEGDPAQTHGNDRLEVAWTIIPVGILIVVAIPTVLGIFQATNSPLPPDKGGLEIEAIGHQWWFEFRYPHPDNPDEQVVSANELHIPVGEPVNFKLGSVDVIHSFWVPKLAGKLDMVPNNENRMWLLADHADEFYGQCAEFCGISHANMKFRVISQDRSDFDAWLRREAANGFEPVEPLAQQGKEVFLSRQAGCSGCHTVNGSDRARGTIGPNLTHVASRGHLAGAIMENTQENLRAWITDPEAKKPGNIMARQASVYNGTNPPLTEPQISALVAYLRTLK